MLSVVFFILFSIKELFDCDEIKYLSDSSVFKQFQRIRVNGGLSKTSSIRYV